MDRGVIQDECVWSWVDNYNETASSHHCYYPRIIKSQINTYFGVGALCNKRKIISEDGESSVEIDDVIPSSSEVGKCKSCERIFKRLEN